MTCMQCGQELPRDDARFCNNCGASLAPQISHIESQAKGENSIPPASQSTLHAQEHRHVLKEQFAHQPRPARLTKHIAPNVPAFPAASSSPTSEQASEQPGELRVHVWNQENVPPQSQIAIDELPTQETPASPPAMSPQRRSVSSMDVRPTPFLGIQGLPSVGGRSVDPDVTLIASHRPQSEFDQLISPPVAQIPLARPVTDVTQPPSLVWPVSPLQSAQPAIGQPVQTGHATPSVPATPFLPSTFTSNAHDRQQVEDGLGPTFAPSFPSSRIKRGPAPLMLFGVVLLSLIIAGVIWASIVQPFNVPAVTKPLQDYQDTHLGIALSYPSDWTVTHQATSDTFSDSSQTAQLVISALPVTTVSAGNVSMYLQKQASKLGMTRAKTVTQATFAGVTWQQVQGAVQVNGVNDTETLFATIQKNHLFMLTQIAPQSVYADEESLIFSKMRTSLHLL